MTNKMLLNCGKILAVVLLVSSHALSAAVCTFQDPASGASFDLSGLTRKDKDYSYPDPTGSWTWTMNVCGASNYGGDCTSQGWGACMTNGVRTISLGTWDETVTWQLIDKFNPSKGVQATLLNGNKCSMPGGKPQARTVIMQFTCPGPETGSFTATENLVACQDMIVFPTDKACPLSSPPTDGGLSNGSVFLIILLVSVILYVVIGCVYKRKVKGTLGREACPNHDFWVALPGLVRDGCRYTANKLKTGCKGGSPQYDTL